jgi:hypothetical protein
LGAFEHGPRVANLPAFLTPGVIGRFAHMRDDMEFVEYDARLRSGAR